MKNFMFICLGVFFIGLSYIGIIMPGVPAIPFILLAAFFLARSSPSLYGWMLRQRLFRKLIEKSKSHKGHRNLKIFVISQLWVSIIVAEIIFVSNIYLGSAIVVVGIIISYFTGYLMDRQQTGKDY